MKIYVHLLVFNSPEATGVVGVYATAAQARLVQQYLGNGYDVIAHPVAGFPWGWVCLGLAVVTFALLFTTLRVL